MDLYRSQRSSGKILSSHHQHLDAVIQSATETDLNQENGYLINIDITVRIFFFLLCGSSSCHRRRTLTSLLQSPPSSGYLVALTLGAGVR